MDAIQFLIDNGKADNQGDVAMKAGLGPNLISRVKNGRVNNVSEDAIRALCSAFPDLNIDYLRGKSDYISRQQLMDTIWAGVIVTDRTVNVNITRLRKKLGKYAHNIVSRQGFGYVFEQNED